MGKINKSGGISNFSAIFAVNSEISAVARVFCAVVIVIVAVAKVIGAVSKVIRNRAKVIRAVVKVIRNRASVNSGEYKMFSPVRKNIRTAINLMLFALFSQSVILLLDRA